MHCPGCGQQQISNETKFCSRCGLPLSVVGEVLSHGGYLPRLADLDKKSKVMTRRNAFGFSLIWLLFFLLIGAPFFAIVGADPMAQASAVFGIFGGLIILTASIFFIKKDIPNLPGITAPPQNQYGLPGERPLHELPPQQSVPASVYATPQAGNWRDTNDLEPQTVTEAATRLLDKEDKL